MLRDFSRIAEEEDGISSDLLRILYYDLKRGYKAQYQSYSSYRLCTIFKGVKEVSINNGDIFTYSSKEYVFLPPYAKVNMSMKSDAKAVVYEVSSHLIQQVENKLESSISPFTTVCKRSYKSSLLQTVSKLSDTTYKKRSDRQYAMDLYAQELVYNLIHAHNEADILDFSTFNAKHHNPVSVAKDILSKCGNECLSVYEVAQKLDMSQANLTYHFKKQMNITPKQFQNQIRMVRAKELLAMHSVTEVGLILGYENISHFIRKFKDYFKLTPYQYKKYNIGNHYFKQ